MSNNKIYIAGRISGIKYETAKKNFRKAEKIWKERGYEVVSPIKLCKKKWSWLRCMIVCLWNLRKCDSVYFMPNSCESRGARIEFWFAQKWGKFIHFKGCIPNKKR